MGGNRDMFGKTKDLQRQIENLQLDAKLNRDEYWKLRHELWTLLHHLGVQIVQQPSKQVVVPIKPTLDK